MKALLFALEKGYVEYFICIKRAHCFYSKKKTNRTEQIEYL